MAGMHAATYPPMNHNVAVPYGYFPQGPPISHAAASPTMVPTHLLLVPQSLACHYIQDIKEVVISSCLIDPYKTPLLPARTRTTPAAGRA